MPDPSSRNPSETHIKAHCKNGHRWTEKWPLPLTLQAFAKRMKAAGECPQCGAPSFLGHPKESS